MLMLFTPAYGESFYGMYDQGKTDNVKGLKVQVLFWTILATIRGSFTKKKVLYRRQYS